MAKEDKVGLEYIGDSDAIGRNSSLILGMFEEESPETIRRREISVLKGRHGETGSFFIKWDFENMDFSEYHESEHILEYV